MKKAKKERRYLPVTILTIVIVLGIVILSELQRYSMTVKTDLANLEYLSAATQRMLKLSVSDKDFHVLYSFLDQEHERILNSDTNTQTGMIQLPPFDDYIYQIQHSWEEVEACLENIDEISVDLLNHVSDNHYFKVSNLTTELNKLEVYTDERIEKLTHLLHFFSLLFTITLFYYHRENKYLHAKSLALAEIATIDQATKLYNRTKCQELFQKNINPNESIGIMVFDLNDLKKTNDSLGHRMGDALITAFSTALADVGNCYSTPPFIGRYGGDEFIVCFENLESSSEITRFLENMEKNVAFFNEHEHEFRVSFAVGYAISEKNSKKTIKELFDEADANMYINKQMKKHGGVLPDGETIQIPTEHQEETSPEEQRTVETTLEIERRKKIATKANLRTCITMAACLVLFFTCYLSFKNSSKEHIDGNVLYIPSDLVEETQQLASPWQNSSFVNLLLHRGLFQMNSDFTEVLPDLASSYQVSSDGLSYEITLKSGLKWSDGTDFTVDDVVFSIESFLRCDDVNSYVATALQTIEGYNVLRRGQSDKLSGLSTEGNKITITLIHPYSNFPLALAQFVPLPKHLLENYPVKELTSVASYYQNPIGTGMYMVDTSDTEEFSLIYNPYYQGTTSEIEKIVLLSDYTPLDIDYYSTNDISQMVNYRSIRCFSEFPIGLYYYRYFIYNIEGKQDSDQENPMKLLKIRQAIAYAIDSETLLDSVYFNAGALLTFGVLDNITGSDLVYAYNPEKAKAFLQEANYDFSRPIRIMYQDTDETTLIFLEKVAQYLVDVGLTVELIHATNFEELYETRDYDLLLKGLSSFNYESWYQEFSSTSPNLSKIFGTDLFDDFIAGLRMSLSEVEYQQTLTELKNLEKDLLYKLPLFTLNQSVYINYNRLSVPEDLHFGNNLFRFDPRFDEWYIIKE